MVGEDDSLQASQYCNTDLMSRKLLWQQLDETKLDVITQGQPLELDFIALWWDRVVVY